MTETIEQIRARFEPLTRGGQECKILDAEGQYIFGRSRMSVLKWTIAGTETEGNFGFDLIPRDTTRELIERATKLREALRKNFGAVSIRYIDEVLCELCAAIEQQESGK